MQEIDIVVPCYNEAMRLERSEFSRLARTEGVSILFVDDGSTDGTRDVLEKIRGESAGRVRSLHLARNSGKGEAVRRGLVEAMGRGAPLVGFLDADLSTSVDEYLVLLDRAREGDADVIMGARVAREGHGIARSHLRGTLGRIFARLACIALGESFSDTQCGAKILVSSDALRTAIAEPFISRWAFDVELLGRLLAGSPSRSGLARSRFVEVPLRAWTDVAGSKVRPLAAMAMGTDLALIALDLRRRRRLAGSS